MGLLDNARGSYWQSSGAAAYRQNVQADQGQKCRKCASTLITNASEYCLRCRPKCKECKLLHRVRNSDFCEGCLSRHKVESGRVERQRREAIEAAERAERERGVAGAGDTCPKCHQFTTFAQISQQRLMCNKCYDVIWPEELGGSQSISGQANSSSSRVRPQQDRANDEKPVKQ